MYAYLCECCDVSSHYFITLEYMNFSFSMCFISDLLMFFFYFEEEDVQICNTETYIMSTRLDGEAK